jgi:curli production assembly/transport component CsgG
VQGGGALSLQYQGPGAGRWAAALTLGRFGLAAGERYREQFNYADLCGLYRLFPREAFTPYVLGGGGLTVRSQPAGFARVLPHLVAGAGVEVLANRRLGVSLGVENHYYLSDQLDRQALGRYNDFYWSARAGLTFYLLPGAGRPAQP